MQCVDKKLYIKTFPYYITLKYRNHIKSLPMKSNIKWQGLVFGHIDLRSYDSSNIATIIVKYQTPLNHVGNKERCHMIVNLDKHSGSSRHWGGGC